MPKRLRLTHEQADWPVEVAGRQITLGEDVYTIGEPDAEGRWLITGPGGQHTGVVAQSADIIWVSIEGHVFDFRAGHASAASRAGSLDAAALMPPMPATVTRIAVEIGDDVAQGDLLIALEAMKMELPIRAPHAFTVAAIHCRVGDMVQPGTVLIE